MGNKVEVVSMVNGTVIFTVPDLRFRREFRKKGARIGIDKDVLEEAMYNPGIEALFQQGILYIEDMDAKKELQLEPEDAEEPENIVVLKDSQMKRYLTVAPVHDLKEIIGKLTDEGLNELVEYAIAHNISDFERATVLKEATGVDILKAIQLKNANEEKD